MSLNVAYNHKHNILLVFKLISMISKKKTGITINVVTEQRLKELRLTEGESIENIILRLIIKYEGIL